MPEETARQVSPGVYAEHTNTAGGRVRFMTNSAYIGLQVVQQLDAGDNMIVDGTHPNDLGFFCMANLIGKTLWPAVTKEESQRL